MSKSGRERPDNASHLEERQTRREATDVKTNADTAREFGHNKLGKILDKKADELNQQADAMRDKRKG